jgi:mRNA interferase HicA
MVCRLRGRNAGSEHPRPHACGSAPQPQRSAHNGSGSESRTVRKRSLTGCKTRAHHCYRLSSSYEADLLRQLTNQGCELLREGGRHSIYYNPKTAATSSVPRHTEINDFLARKICRDLGIPLLQAVRLSVHQSIVSLCRKIPARSQAGE